MNKICYFAGAYEDSDCYSYRHDGVTIHKPPRNDRVWEMTAFRLYHFFMDLEHGGMVTDKFYGSCNDFNDVFLAKAAMGHRFMVVCGRDQKEALTHVATRIGTLEQQPDGSWYPVEYEPLQRINGQYFLYNGLYSYALQHGEVSGDMDAVIQKSLECGEEMVWRVIGK